MSQSQLSTKSDGNMKQKKKDVDIRIPQSTPGMSLTESRNNSTRSKKGHISKAFRKLKRVVTDGKQSRCASALTAALKS